MADSSKSIARKKPSKPYDGFPMFPHATGRWAKKIRGKLHYFGPWRDPDGALERLNRELPYLRDGRTPPPIDIGDGLTVADMCNAFLTAKRRLMDSGDIQPKTFEGYYSACVKIVAAFGNGRRVDDLRPDDFGNFRAQLAKTHNPTGLKTVMTGIRVVFKFASDEQLIDRPVHYGQSFNRPAARQLRQARHDRGSQMFEPDELRQLLDAADNVMRAMILLGVNGGLGNSDIAKLPQSAVDFVDGWINFPRPKTGINRRIPLWPEAADALQTALSIRPKPSEPTHDKLCFLTTSGNPWVRTQRQAGDADRFVTCDALSQKFAKLMKKAELNGHRGFYALRHTFETIAGDSRDQIAVNAIMGHVDDSMAATYRERISDERLRAVTEHVRRWLFETDAADDAAGGERTGE